MLLLMNLEKKKLNIYQKMEMFFNWFLCFATSFVIIFFHLQIVNVEEDFLIEAFGEEYLKYRTKVCRYLGRKL